MDSSGLVMAIQRFTCKFEDWFLLLGEGCGFNLIFMHRDDKHLTNLRWIIYALNLLTVIAIINDIVLMSSPLRHSKNKSSSSISSPFFHLFLSVFHPLGNVPLSTVRAGKMDYVLQWV